MASDELLREGVRQQLTSWSAKLECGGDIEKQQFFKKKFIEQLKNSSIAIDTDLANEQHYEIPTEFFLTVLGKRLKYSCCYWPDDVTTLEEAEEASLCVYCERAGVRDGHRVLDLGCGWGSLGLYICETYPNCQVTCLSNSTTQRQYIESEGRKRGYTSRLECITCDVNVFTTSKRFDRIISIEMFEHMKNYRLLMERVSSWLKPSGYLFTQCFCHRQFPYAFDTNSGSDTEWMARTFFSGGTMPSSDLLLYFQNDMVLTDQWVLNGQHYSRTLEAWLTKLDRNIGQVKDILQTAYGDDFSQQLFNWRLFFMFCSEVFNYDNGNQWHVVYHLFKKRILSSL